VLGKMPGVAYIDAIKSLVAESFFGYVLEITQMSAKINIKHN